MTARAAACCSPGECPRVLKYAVLLRAFPGRQHRDSSTEKVDATMSDTVTRGIRVIVKPRFLAEQSDPDRSEEHTSELQSLMRISYAVFCLKKTKYTHNQQ